MIGAFTLISNPAEEGEMTTRALERSSKTSAKNTTAAAKTTKPQAQLVLANGEHPSEAMRLGMSLLGAGVTAVGIGVLEGMARTGKVRWWRDMSPYKKAILLYAVMTAAAGTARWRRKKGDYKTAAAMEATAIAAFTLATVALVESGMSKGGEVKGLGFIGDDPQAAIDRMDERQLAQLDAVIDDDIRRAAQELRAMQEREAKLAAGPELGALEVVEFETADFDDIEY